MTDRAGLARLGKLVAEDVVAGRPGKRSRAAGDVLEKAPELVIDLVELLAAEARRKRPSEKLIAAYVYLVVQALEFLRFRIEGGQARAAETAATLRERVKTLVEGGEIEPRLLLLILGAFSTAKLDAGDDLRLAMASLAGDSADEATAASEDAELEAHLRSLVEGAEGDPFAVHAELLETAEAFPAEHRAAMGVMLLRSDEPVAREAAVGWLLDSSAQVRDTMAGAVEQAAPTGAVSGLMLRRMITLRNWLPEANRAALDRAIQACRRKGVACAAWPAAQVREIRGTGVDGAGAQSIFAVAREGRKSAVGCLLVKLSVGVRDAWARHALSRAELDGFLAQVDEGVDVYATGPDYVRIAASHFLSVNLASGVMPPFGMLDFAETVGLQALQPEAWPTSRLLDRLEAGAPPALLEPKAIKAALNDGRQLADRFAFLDSWFEDDDELNALLTEGRRSRPEQIAQVRDVLLPARREKWTSTLAWTALMLQQSEQDEDWPAFFIAARELASGRAPVEIPAMTLVAAQTVAAFADRRRERGQ